jgi:hypothetical protein
MTDTASGEVVLHAQPNVSVRRAYDGSMGCEISWGEGSGREHFQTESAELAACLATMPNPTTTAEVVGKLSSERASDRRGRWLC